MEDIIKGWKRLVEAFKSRLPNMVLFVLASLAVAFVANLPVFLLNHSWLDGSVFIKHFYDSASASVTAGTDMVTALRLEPLGNAGLLVFAGSLWKYLFLLPFEIAIFLPMLSPKIKNPWPGIKRLPAVIGIQIFTGLCVIVLAAIGIAITIALFAGAAAPFFMIIVLVAALFLIVVLILAPFGHVVDGMPMHKSVAFSFNKSLKYGWTIFLVLIIPSIVVSMAEGWVGNIGVVCDIIALAFFLPQYSTLMVVYERMKADALQTGTNI